MLKSVVGFNLPSVPFFLFTLLDGNIYRQLEHSGSRREFQDELLQVIKEMSDQEVDV